MSKLCGKDLSCHVGSNSPFGQVVFIGYDDGPTSGAVKCSANLDTYRFEMLARDIDGRYDWQAWDRGEEIRIFSLAPLPTLACEQLTDTLLQEESTRKMAEDETYFKEVYSILNEANSPELVIATHGISTSIIAVSQVTLEEIANIKDWFSFLGFVANV